MTASSSPPVPGRSASRAGPEKDGPQRDGSRRELTLRTIEDAILLKERVASRPSVIVVGGGPLGMEVASGCPARGLRGHPRLRRQAPVAASWATIWPDIFTAAAIRRGLRVVGGGKARLDRSRCRDTGRPGRRHRTGGRPGRHRHRRRAEHRLARRLEPSRRRSAAGRLARPAPAGHRRRRRRGVLPDPPRGATGAPVDQRHRPGQGRRRRPPARGRGARARLPALLLDRGLRPLAQVGRASRRCRRLPTTASRARAADSMLLRWDNTDGSGTAAAINYRIPVPKLRRLADAGPGAASGAPVIR